MLNVLELKDNLIKASEEVIQKWNDLQNDLSIADKKKTDIEHYIEFNDLNASQGFKAYKLLQEALEERRKIKNSIDEIRPLFQFLNDRKIMLSINKISNSIEGIINKNKNAKELKTYKVRVLKELFGEEMKLK